MRLTLRDESPTKREVEEEVRTRENERDHGIQNKCSHTLLNDGDIF